MASTVQQRHHAKFHAAVLRNLFRDDASSPAPSPSAAAAASEPDSLQEPEVFNLSQEEVDDDDDDDDEKAEAVHVETASQFPKEEEKNIVIALSRAQRRRHKLKKSKEAAQVGSLSKGFIGPLPDNYCEHDSPNDGDCSSDVMLHEGNTLDEPSFSAAEEGNIADGELGSKSLSRSKKRRLAKKKWQNLSRHPSSLPFTAEVKGSDIVMQQVTQVST